MPFTKNQLKPDIQLSIATYNIVGELNSASVDELLNRIENHLHILRGLHVKGLLLSFKHMTKIDKKSLEEIIESFGTFHVKMRAMIGFCNYSEKTFPVLRKLIQSTPLGLYKDVNIMALAIGTSNIHTKSPILVYSDNVDERQVIASTLISNNYFVVMAVSQNDLAKKAKQKDRFDRIISNSYFSNIHDEVTISFQRNIFIYEFQGTLDETIAKRIDIEDFKYRLSLGYHVIIFDFTRIYHMNLRAAYFLIELEELASSYDDVLICAIDLNEYKIDTNALGVLDKSSVWLFDDLNHIFSDKEVLEKTVSRTPQFSSGISKKLLELTPHLVRASMQSLKIYEILNEQKSSFKQINVRQLHSIKPSILTHIEFSGDFEGELLFLFSQESAKILVKQILVDVGSYNLADYLDAMSEYVNSVTGKLKSNLRKKNKCIQFSLPFSTVKLEEFIPKDMEQSFILTNYQCNEKNYYVALTAPIE